MYQYHTKHTQKSKKYPFILGMCIFLIFYIFYPIFGLVVRVVGDELMPNIKANTVLWLEYTQQVELGDLVLIYTANDAQCAPSVSTAILYQLFTDSHCFAIRRIVGMGDHKYQVKHGKIIQDQQVHTYQLAQATEHVALTLPNTVAAQSNPSSKSLHHSFDPSFTSKNLQSNHAYPVNVLPWYEFIKPQQAYLIYIPLKVDAQHLNIPPFRLNKNQYFVLCDHRVECLSPHYHLRHMVKVDADHIIAVVRRQLSI